MANSTQGVSKVSKLKELYENKNKTKPRSPTRKFFDKILCKNNRISEPDVVENEDINMAKCVTDSKSTDDEVTFDDSLKCVEPENDKTSIFSQGNDETTSSSGKSEPKSDSIKNSESVTIDAGSSIKEPFNGNEDEVPNLLNSIQSEDRSIINAFSNTDFVQNLRKILKMLLTAKCYCVVIYEERLIHDCENLIDLLIKIEEIGFTKLIKIDLPHLDDKQFTDCFKIDLENALCNFHVDMMHLRQLFFQVVRFELNEENLHMLFDVINSVIERVITLQKLLCVDYTCIDDKQFIQNKVKIFNKDKLMTLGDFYKQNRVSDDFKRFLKVTMNDYNTELINRRKNGINSKILSALDAMFTSDCQSLSDLTNVTQNIKFCDNLRNGFSNYNVNNNYMNLNQNNNSSNGSGSNLAETLLNHKDLQKVLQNPIVIGNKKATNLFSNYLEKNPCALLNDKLSLNSYENHLNSSTNFSRSSKSLSNNLLSNLNNSTLRNCMPIECNSSKCAEALMKFNVPNFFKTKSNTPSLTVAEMDSEKLKLLTRINKTNEFGAEQFISYKFDLKRSN